MLMGYTRTWILLENMQSTNTKFHGKKMGEKNDIK